MKNILIPLISAVLLTSCATVNYSYDGNAFKKSMHTITQEDLKKNLYVIASDEMEGRNTGSAGQKKAGEYIIKQYKDMGVPHPTPMSSYYQKVPANFLNAKRAKGLPDSENILAFIKGSEKPDEIIVISAHYDHVGTQNGVVYNGADDDGSGTVALIEIAEAFQHATKAGHGPKRSVLLLHVTGEEHGLLGSDYYSENPVFPLVNTVANLNIDMIGRCDPANCGKDYVYVIGSQMLSSDLKKINEAGKTVIMATHDYAMLMKFPAKTLKCEDSHIFEVVQKTA